MASRATAFFLATAAMLLARAALAAHPLQTEDTGTQGTGNVELENGFSSARSGGTSISTYQPQLSAGMATTLDAIVQPSLVRLHASGRPAVSGRGDTNLDAKWRFWGADPWSFAVRAGVQLPTSQNGLGLPHGQASEHLLLVATWDAAPTTVHANIGITHEPRAAGGRLNIGHLSAALMQALDEHLILTIDGEFDQDSGAARQRWPGSMLGGAIYTVRPGLDLDVGYQVSVRATPVARQWLAGLTYRFSL